LCNFAPRNRIGMKRSTFLYHVLAFVVVAIWGVTFISTKVLLAHGLHPTPIFAIRFAIAYAGMILFCLIHRTRLFAHSWADEAVFLLLGVVGGSAYFLTENTALRYTQACNVSFIVCSTPLITTLLTIAYKRLFHGFLSEGLEDVRVTPSLVIGTIVTFVGMGLVIFSESQFHFSIRGDLLSVGAAITWALYSILMGQMTMRYGTLLATRKVFFYGLLTIAPLLIWGEGSVQHIDPQIFLDREVIFNLLFLSVIASLVCFVCWNVVMARIGNVTSTNYVYLNPFFTLVAGVLLLGERMTFLSAIGSVAIVAGVVLAGRRI